MCAPKKKKKKHLSPVSNTKNHTSTVLRYAITSRILVITLIILWRSLLSPYDTSASLNPNCLSPFSKESAKPSPYFPSIGSAIEESIVWDSVYFVRVAQCGYSESLYALFSIGGLYYLMTGSNNVPVLWFALSGSARSNGILNAGYYGFKTLHQSYYAMFVKKRAHLVLQVLFAGALRCICILLPFLAFQAYGYYNMCHGHGPDGMRPWCKAKPPLLYSFIQSHYWGVGFLRYFQLKQLPNFLLASPVLSLAFCSIQSYLKFEPENFFSLGFGAATKEKNPEAVLFAGWEERVRDDDQYTAKPEAINLRRRHRNKTQETSATSTESKVLVKPSYYSVIVLPFIYHLGFMAATAFFVMHVQVATRFLSASPPLYWFASYLMASLEKRRWAYLIWAYAASYILLGSLLFSNFYPFT